MAAGGREKSLSLWCGDDPAECTGAFSTPWATLPPLGLVEIRWGDELLIILSLRHICPFLSNLNTQQSTIFGHNYKNNGSNFNLNERMDSCVDNEEDCSVDYFI